MSSINKQLFSISCAGRKPASSSSSVEIRLVLLGKTGSGKSSTGNSILGRKIFDSRVSSSSVTQHCRKVSGEFRGRHLALLDTPGLLDTHQAPQEVQKELRRSVSLLYPGPHVFLLIIQIGRFTREEKEVVRQIKQAMGSHALSFSVVVFTHGDLLEEGASAIQCLIDGCNYLVELVAGCGGRYCVFNNQSSKNKEQVTELLALVDSTIQGNGGTFYGSRLLQEAKEDLAQELQEERRVLGEMEELRKNQELEKTKAEKLKRDQEEAYRRGMEENDKKEKERQIQEMIRVIKIRREEEEKRVALQENLHKVIKTLEEQEGHEEKMRRAMEEQIRNDRVENDKKESERERQQIQKEQAIRQREEMKSDALEKELEKLSRSLEEPRGKGEDRKKKMEDLLRHEREENQRERDIQMKNQRAEKRRIIALQQELKLTRMKVEQQKAGHEKLKRQLEENLWKKREKCDNEMSMLTKQCDEKCSEKTENNSAEKHSTVTTMAGFAQEMGLVGLNAALESIGAPCCIQ